MKVFVYGTLKRGYWNNRLLFNCEYVKDHTLNGYKLYNAGFPVATPAEGCSVVGEVFEIPKDIEPQVIASLDRLEGVPTMYTREEQGELNFYVGNPSNWDFSRMKECPNENNVYVWSGRQ